MPERWQRFFRSRPDRRLRARPSKRTETPTTRERTRPEPRRPSREPPEPLSISVVADPEFGERERQQALELISRLERWAPRPVLHARVTLQQLPDPALLRPAIAKATLDVNGRPVRAHVAAETVDLALGRLEERLRRQLEGIEETRRADRHETGIAEKGEWRHADRPASRPEYFDRPIEERELVRLKTYDVSALTPEQAVLEMEALDHDFHQFTNSDTGEESVVYRRPAGGIGLLCVHPLEAQHAEDALSPDPSPAPVLALEDAIDRLNVSGEQFVFYVDAETGLGNVLYRRYDGHYGLLEPVGSA